MKILICDDHKIVRDGLRQILTQTHEDVKVFEASGSKEAFGLLKNHVDVMLLDLTLGDENGLDVLKKVKAKWPLTRVLILSMHPQEQYAIRALKYGAYGYLTTDIDSEELIFAVKEVADGKRYISRALANALAESFAQKEQYNHEQLSEREFQVFVRLAKGKTLLEIGSELFISPKTVSTYRIRLMEKMKFDSNAELVKYCLEKKLI